MKEITVDAVISEVPTVTDFIDSELEISDCPMRIRMQLNVAIDELFSNIAFYAYRGTSGKVSVQVNVIPDSSEVEITFIDNGKPYNPLMAKEPDITQSADEREIGGLGIFIVKKTMDNISYEYVDKQNRLTIRKSWKI